MKALSHKHLEARLHAAARSLEYPPTPDVSRLVRFRLMKPRLSSTRLILRTAALAFVILLALALAVPQVRAQLAGFFQIGVIRIFPFGPLAPAAQIPTTATPIGSESPTPKPGASSLGTAENLPAALRDLAGLTTLPEAQKLTGFPIHVPAYPADLGQPDFVFYQPQIRMLVLAWREPADPQKVRLSLHEFLPGEALVNKYKPVIVQETSVNGNYAVWAKGPYMAQATNGNYVLRRIVEGHSLIWEEGGVTYRLETDLPLAEAVKIAESLQPLRSTEIPIPADLDLARTLVQWLSDSGVAVSSVQHSIQGSLFQSANQAAWIETDIGIADAVFFLDPADTGHIQVTPLQSQQKGRYLYTVQAPSPIMLETRTMDAAYPLYFTVRSGVFIVTSSEELDKTLQRLPAEISQVSASGAFELTGEQAQEIAVFMDFIRAYNNGQPNEALALLAGNVGVSDCDYRKLTVVTFQGKLQVEEWLRQRISDHDELEVSRIENENPDPVSGRHVIGVEYSRRTSLTLMDLGFSDGITPKLASKVIFTAEPALIQSFANGPQGGDPGLCRPGN